MSPVLIADKDEGYYNCKFSSKVGVGIIPNKHKSIVLLFVFLFRNGESQQRGKVVTSRTGTSQQRHMTASNHWGRATRARIKDRRARVCDVNNDARPCLGSQQRHVTMSKQWVRATRARRTETDEHMFEMSTITRGRTTPIRRRQQVDVHKQGQRPPVACGLSESLATLYTHNADTLRFSGNS